MVTVLAHALGVEQLVVVLTVCNFFLAGFLQGGIEQIAFCPLQTLVAAGR